jgi:transcriptional regulator with XRE-family HTH domain
MSLGSQLKAARARTGKDQTELGEVLGVNRTTISRWERDEAVPQFDDVVKVAHVTGWPLDLFARAASIDLRGPDSDPGQQVHESTWKRETAGGVVRLHPAVTPLRPRIREKVPA